MHDRLRVEAVLRKAARAGAASVVIGPQAGRLPSEIANRPSRRSSALYDAVKMVGQEMRRVMMGEDPVKK